MKWIFPRNPVNKMLLAAAILFVVFRPASALDFSKKYVQKTGREFFASLKERPGEPRAIFFDAPGAAVPPVLYAMYSKKGGTLYVFGKLGRYADGIVSKEFRENSTVRPFSIRRRDGSVFYARGKCLGASLALGARETRSSDGSGKFDCAVTYVPYAFSGAANDAFISDPGYVEMRFDYGKFVAGGREDEKFRKAVKAVFREDCFRPAHDVEFNRYYFDRPDFFGFVDPAPRCVSFMETAVLPPTHKMTKNKKAVSGAEKAAQDAADAINCLSTDYPLISQDLRAKIGAVEPDTRLDLRDIGQTDIGSGQNSFVYISYGPGINYYDAPYGDTRPVSLAPRFIFSDDILYRGQVQFYPKNSWETRGRGIARYNEINAFQTSLSTSGEYSTSSPLSPEPEYMPPGVREKYFAEINRALFRYGLMNDTGELLLDFDFMGERHTGNPVNNEVRCLDAVYPGYSSRAMIVPAGMSGTYLRGFEDALKKGRVNRFLGGTYYKDYFIEAACTGEAGMRAAYLEYLIFCADTSLYSMVRSARASGSPEAYIMLVKSAAKTIEKCGPEFFRRPAARSRRSALENSVAAYHDYLEAVRDRRGPNVRKRLWEKFVKAYNAAGAGMRAPLSMEADDARR